MKKRIIALLMCFVLSFSLVAETLTYSAAADDTDTGSGTTAVDPDASNDGESTDTTVTLTLNLNGGTGIHSIRAAEGTAVTVPNPTREGCTFLGWSDGQGIVVNPTATVTVTNTTYIAAWQEPTESVAVKVQTYTKAAGSETSTFESEKTIYAAAGDVIKQDTLESALICGKAEHTHTAACAGNCSHVHSITCFGFTADAKATELDASTQEKINALGTGYADGWYIYQIGEACYLRHHDSNNGDSYYKYETAPSDYVMAGADCVYDAKCTAHTHEDGCYNCGKEAHTHADACYQNILPSGTVTMSPESLTVSADTENVISLTAEAAAEVKDSYTVTVNFVMYDGGSTVADAQSFTVKAGDPFTETVTFPTVYGYEPRIYDAETNQYLDAESYTFAIESISADETLTVYYAPSRVQYTVQHLLQDVNSDTLYNLELTETKYGYTGRTTDDVARDFSGFYALSYDSSIIRADGTTVVKVYYDRRTYSISFNTDGGTTMDTIELKYGAAVPTITPPTKENCTFSGWGLVTGNNVHLNAEIPATMPAENLEYKALWIEGETAKVTLRIWGEKADSEQYEFIQKQEIVHSTGTIDYDDVIYKLACTAEEHTHTDSCLNCTHTHTLADYGITTEDSVCELPYTEKEYFAKLSGGLENGYIYYLRSTIDGTEDADRWYLRFNDKWYRYGESAYIIDWDYVKPEAYLGSRVAYIKENPTSAELWYEKYKAVPASCTHDHNESGCYICGKTEHTHTAECYTGIVNMDGSKWTVAKVQCGDTVLDEKKETKVNVAADGTTVIDVYCDRRDFTLTFISGAETIKTITAKWGQNISTEFPIKDGDADTYWVVPKGAQELTPGNTVTVISTMPAENLTFTKAAATATAAQAKIVYYVESLSGETGDKTVNGKNYDIYKEILLGWTIGKTLTKDDFIAIEGFTAESSDPALPDSGKVLMRTTANGQENAFYYTRNSYTLKFCYSDGKEIKSVTYQYGASLANAGFTPEAVDANTGFAGWYTDSACAAGTEYTFGSTATMPAEDLTLYAKFDGKTCGVYTFLTEDDANIGTEKMLQSFFTTYGKTVGDVEVKTPVNGDYTFRGWYYRDDKGIEHTFSFTNTEITGDTFVYAKWTSGNVVDYTVYYTLEDGTQIAAPTTGSAPAGEVKTFSPKQSSELNEGYRTGWFPESRSESLTLTLNGENSVRFVYKQSTGVQYTVKYFTKDDQGDNTNIFDGKKVDSDEYTATTSTVTVTAKAIEGYYADHVQQTLTVLPDGTNEITFYYTKSENQNRYLVQYLLENTDGTWSVHKEESEVGTVNDKIDYNDNLNITGFTYSKIVTTCWDGNGDPTIADTLSTPTIVKVYYTRNKYAYTIHYLLQGTETPVAEDVTGEAYYASDLTVQAKEIPGYTLVSDAAQTRAVSVDPAQNVITFYYIKTADAFTITVNYVKQSDGTAVHDPETFKASIGDSFTQTVKFPTVVGYEPRLYDADTNQLLDAESYTFAIDSVSEDVTLTVYYVPSRVQYTVQHWLQNAEDDKYALYYSDTEYVYYSEGATVGDVALEIDGCTVQTYEHPVIKADGSTLVNIYYDRSSYRISFDLDGGTGVDDVEAKYGAKVSAVADPTKSGSTFVCWALDTGDGNYRYNETIPETMPAMDVTYKAIWTENENAKVTLNILGEKADGSGYEQVDTQYFTHSTSEAVTFDELILSKSCAYDYEHTHSENCENCRHSHGAAEYGLDDTYTLNMDGYLIEDFAELSGGIESGYIYHLYSTVFLETDCWYFYLDGVWYRFGSAGIFSTWDYKKPSLTILGDRVDIIEFDQENSVERYEKYNATAAKCTHTHTQECYSCGKTEHTHTADCYRGYVNMDGSRWTLRKVTCGDTELTGAAGEAGVKVESDGSTVITLYYDRKAFTLTFEPADASTAPTVKISAKWGADISGNFPITVNGETANWIVPEGATQLTPNARITLLQTMPAESLTLTQSAAAATSNRASIIYYLETLTGEEGSITHNGKNYNVYRTVDLAWSLDKFLTQTEDFFDIEGFTQADSDPDVTKGDTMMKPTTLGDNVFYYTRNTYALKFYSGEAELKSAQVQYQAALSEQVPEVTVPEGYTFAGWYTDPAFVEGSEYTIGDDTAMPAKALTLYAKFEGVQCNVYTFQSEYYANLGAEKSMQQWTVEYGKTVGTAEVTTPTNGSYTFRGWYYRDSSGKEQTFNFESTAVKGDMYVYAKWTSGTTVDYTVYYELEDGTQIADPTTGSGKAGESKDLTPKDSTKLYADYQQGYFPTEQKKQITLSETGVNSVTFVYAPKSEGVKYTVNYYIEGTTTPLLTSETLTAYTTTVTVQAQSVKTEKGYYYADAVEKTLTLNPDAQAENVITFYYTETSSDESNRENRYLIRYYRQTADGTGKELFKTVDGVGTVNSEITVDTPTITGFRSATVYSNNESSGKHYINDTWQSPTIVKVEYSRNKYPYEIRYLLSGTNEELASTEKGWAFFESELSATAKDIRGYTLVSDPVRTINIAAATEDNANVITFYYTKNETETGTYTVTVHYRSMTKTVTDGSGEKVTIGTGEAPEGVTDFTATVEATKACTATVTFPVVAGYTAKMLDSTNQWRETLTYTFNIEHVTEDITVDVRYDPDRVEYTVNHYLANLDGTYPETPTSTQTNEGFTGFPVGNVSLAFVGYYALTYEHPTIAYDGSTVVNIYYARRSYTLSFDYNGGTGTVSTITAPYGTAVQVDTPTREGYVFNGWWLVEGSSARESTLPETMPAANATFRASWSVAAGEVKVKVNYYLEDANGDYNLSDTVTAYAETDTELTPEALTNLMACETPAHEHTLSCLACTHTHTPECYGLTEEAKNTTTTVSSFHYLFDDTDGGWEDGCIYSHTYDIAAPLTLHSKTIRNYYLYLNGSFYNYPSEDYALRYLSTQRKGVDLHTKNKGLSDEFQDYTIKFDGRTPDCWHHMHTAECFTCGYVEHEHSSNCYMDLTTLPGENWTFESDSYVATYGKTGTYPTVANDSSTSIDLYFKRSKFTLTFVDAGGKTVTSITAEAGSNIAKYFSEEPLKDKTWKCTESHPEFSDKPVQTIETMPYYDATFKLYTDGDNKV